LSVDGFWKIFGRREIIIEHEKKIKNLIYCKKNLVKRIKFPIYFYASLDNNGTFIPFAFSISNTINGEMLADAIKIIGKVSAEAFNNDAQLNKTSVENKIFKPLLMNDGGTVEAKMNEILEADLGTTHILCRFHLIQNIYKELKKKIKKTLYNKDTIISEILNFIYKMMSTVNDENFNEEYKKFVNFIDKKQKNDDTAVFYKEFLNYFNKIYLQKHQYWNISNRSFNINLFSTNNLMELWIRGVTNSMKGNKRKFKRIDDLFSFLWEILGPMENTDMEKTPIGKEFQSNYSLGYNLLKNKKLKVTKIKENNENSNNIKIKKNAKRLIRNTNRNPEYKS
jgi:hypothetical protein